MSLDTAENVTSAVVTDFNTSKMTEKQKKSMLKRTMTMVKGTVNEYPMSPSLILVASQLGTLAWSAPEVLEEKFPDDKGDVYSFAVILWEIVARVMPYVFFRLLL